MIPQLNKFLYTHPVFTIDEIREGLAYKGSGQGLRRLISEQLRQHRIIKIRNGVYASVPPTYPETEFLVDQYLVASRLASDSVIGYQSALGFWGLLHSVRNDITYISEKKLTSSHFDFQGVRYKGVSYPGELVVKEQTEYGIRKQTRLGLDVKVTGIERTLVDILDRPKYLGYDWEELYRSLGKISHLNLDEVIEYTLLLSKGSLCSKVGYFLEIFREVWYVQQEHLNKLLPNIAKKPYYLHRKSNEKQVFVPRWNVLVPESLEKQSWEEPYVDI